MRILTYITVLYAYLVNYGLTMATILRIISITSITSITTLSLSRHFFFLN